MHKFTGRASALALAVGVALAGTAHADVVISQVYGGGGNAGATYKADFIELHNNGATAVDLSTWSVQYASSTGTTWQRTNLAGSIAPGGYYLVKQADGTGAAPLLPTPDATGTIAMSGSAGKVALVNAQTTLAGACPTGTVDFLGFGSASNCAEASAPTANLGNAIAALRADGGCTDTNNNAADFTLATPAARNSASALKACGPQTLPVLTVADASVAEGNSGTSTLVFTVSLSGDASDTRTVDFDYATADGTATVADGDYVAASGHLQLGGANRSATISVTVNTDTRYEPAETLRLLLSNVTGALLGDGDATGTIGNDDLRALSAIHDVQGAGARSPLVGQGVDVQGVVTGRKSNGFFVQAADADADADPATSEGLFVFTGSTVPAAAAVGNVVRVGGTVIEYVPSTDPGQLPLTELGSVTDVTLVSAGAALPTPVPLRTDFPSPAGALDQLEPLEGMLVTVADATVVAPTQGNTNETSATGTSNGLFNVVVTGTPRPFREPGIQAPDLPPGGGTVPPIPRWDFNPEVITVDSDALGGTRLDLAFDTRLANLTGPLDYGFRRYSILPLAQGAITVTPGAGSTPRAAAAPQADAFTVGGYNMERFFDTVNDPAVGEPVLTAAAFDKRLSKASIGVRDYLRSPDILATVEIENLTTLQALADRINNDAVTAGQPNPGYVAYLIEGNDVGGIDVGFLVKTATVGTATPRIEVKAVTQVGKDVTWTEPAGTTALLNDRPPLALDAVVHYADGRAFPVNVVVVHQRSLNGADANDADGARIRLKRLHQAEFLAGYLNGRQRNEPGLHLVVLGDFNAFEFNDGLVDAMNVVTGTPTADAQTAVPGDGADLVDPDLLNLGSLAPASERYSFVFGGNAQTLDHVLVNEELVLQTASIVMDHARINADFPETNRNDANSPSRLADHDPVLASFVPRHHADLAVGATSATPVHPLQPMVFNVRLDNRGPDSATAPGIGFAVDAVLPALAVTTVPAGFSCDAAQVQGARTSIACTASGLGNGQQADFVLQAPTTVAMTGQVFTLAAAAQAQSLDDVAGNNEASAQVAVQAEADLSVRLNGPGTQLRTGAVGRFPLTVINMGPDAAASTRVVVRGNAAASAVRVTADASWGCQVASVPAGFELSCLKAAVPRGVAQMLDVAVTAPNRVGDTLALTATVASAAVDPATGNNSAAASTRIIAR